MKREAGEADALAGVHSPLRVRRRRREDQSVLLGNATPRKNENWLLLTRSP